MTGFGERERAFEEKFAHDEELRFRVMVLRNRLLAQWAAQEMQLAGDAASRYAQAITDTLFKPHGPTDLGARILADLHAAGSALTAIQVQAQLAHFESRARHEVMTHEGGVS